MRETSKGDAKNTARVMTNLNLVRKVAGMHWCEDCELKQRLQKLTYVVTVM
jgi:hypothetical protein